MLLAGLAACAAPTAVDYFPNAEGNTWQFATADGSQRITWRIGGWGMRSIDTLPAQMLIMNQDTNGFSKGPDGTWLHGLLGFVELNPTLLLPPQVSDTSAWISETRPETATAHVEGFEDVTVPAGRFVSCLKVRYRGGRRNLVIWYAPDKGPVRMAIRNPVALDSALGTRLLQLTSLRLNRRRVTPPSFSALRTWSYNRLIWRNMKKLQLTIEAWGFVNDGRFPSPDLSWQPDDTLGMAFFLPGGEPHGVNGPRRVGAYPINPYTGEHYRPDHDFFYWPDSLPFPGACSLRAIRHPRSPFRTRVAPAGVPGTIIILGYTAPGSADRRPTEYAIIGYGADPTRLITEPDPKDKRQQRFLVITHQ